MHIIYLHMFFTISLLYISVCYVYTVLRENLVNVLKTVSYLLCYYVRYIVKYTVYGIQYTVCSIQYTVYFIQYTVYSIEYTV
jgi:hypothetical protein